MQQVIKDVRPLHPLLRWFYGRRLLRREERALRRLNGAAGAPRPFGWVDPNAFSMEFRAGLPMRGRHATEEPERFARASLDLEAKITELHALGVVHLDLKQRRNILVDVDGSVSLLDFESALLLSDRGFGGWLRDRLAPMDRNAALKFKAKFAPQSMTEEERARFRRAESWASLWFFHHIGAALRWLFGHRSSKP